MIGGKLVEYEIIKMISDPAVAQTFGIGKADIRNVASVLKVIVNSPDIIITIGKNGSNAFKGPVIYQMIGSLLANNVDHSSILYDVGLAVAFNATVLAKVGNGDLKLAADEFYKLNIEAPLKDIQGARGLAA